ncbi:copine protein [Medicago truncatula]|uniref:Copine protein n=1 Tax=Medicago truncatula TaxID=3880 RepID=A0A072VJ91_MEDTR|nr:copine protein [Medicago truncatula]
MAQLLPLYTATTHDQGVFSFHSDHSPCHGFEEVLAFYKKVVPNLKLSGPTSYAPVIEAAIDIVEKSHGQFHVLVTKSVDNELSPQERKTIKAIADARRVPGRAKKIVPTPSPVPYSRPAHSISTTDNQNQAVSIKSDVTILSAC